MASEHVLELTDANFESEVMQSDKPVMVDFWAEWCQPCRRLAPAVEEVAEQFAGRAKVGKVDIESNREITQNFDIQAIPTIIVFKSGKIVDRFTGLRGSAELSESLERALAE
ncbi:MAG: thioredoxin [Planctomycetota bacterium]|nr:MAG: thioredoxin [Planctomycetota bacterium]